MFDKIIKVGKYDFIENEEIRFQIQEAGRRKVVFVEGKSDKRIFEIIFDNELDAKYIGAGNCGQVKKYLEKCISKLSYEKRYYGIIDRDFITIEAKSEMERDLKFGGCLYIHDRYTIENYFVEPEILKEFFKDCDLEMQESNLTELIKEIYRSLKEISATNYYLLKNEQQFLQLSTPNDINIIKKKINNNDIESETHYIEKIKEISNDESINKYHSNINGKYFFYALKNYLKSVHNITNNFEDDKFKYMLARIFASRKEICQTFKASIIQKVS